MNLTDKQKKIVLIVAAVFIGSYVVRYVVNFAASAAYSHQLRSAQAEAKRAQVPATTQPTTPAVQPATQAPPANPVTVDSTPTVAEAEGAPAQTPSTNTNVPPPPPPVSVPASFGVLSGQWSGRTSIRGRGTCIVSLELNESAPGQFSGFSKIVCFPDSTVSPQDRAAMATNPTTNPQAAIFSGGIEKDAFRLKVEKSIAPDIHGCHLSGMDLNSFGARQLAATWIESAPTCSGGTVILNKAR